MSEKMLVKDVIFREDLYPRFEMDNDAVERYRANLEELPPILVTNENILVDGKHRLRAHQLARVDEIEADRIDLTDDNEILKESIRRNAKHGQQLDSKEKKDLAQRLFDDNVDELVELLAVSKSIIFDWTMEQRTEAKDARDKQIIQMYLNLRTQQWIADELGIGKRTVERSIAKIPELEKWREPPDSIQYYDVWNFPKLDRQYGQEYEGRIPGQIIENVLWYFTKPKDMVCDPMVGGGTTLDVCNAMYRRCLGLDTNPVHDRTIEHDLRNGYPEGYLKADLIFMDPPYFKKKSEEYQLAEELDVKDNFIEFAKQWVEFCNQGLKKDGIVALLISDYIDYGDPLQSIFSYEYQRLFQGYTTLYKISVPLSTQQYKGFQVNQARDAKKILIIGRELYIMQKGR